MPPRHRQHTGKEGFTLIELSIVLVIIGLIIGAIFVGRDLIMAAEIRSVVSQIGKYDAAVNTFHEKYNGLPGDLLASQAAQLGFISRSGNAADGDNNGAIETCDTNDTPFSWDRCETALFWSDLAQAGLIPGDFSAETDGLIGINAPNGQQDAFVPKTRLGNNNWIAMLGTWYCPPIQCTITPPISGFFMSAGQHYVNIPGNYYGVGNLYVASGAYEATPSITPMQALAIDTKMDDGLPYSGRVWAAGNILSGGLGFVTTLAVSPGAFLVSDACVSFDFLVPTKYSYNTIDSVAVDRYLCLLVVRGDF